MNYTAKIDVTKIDKASLYKGKFLDLVLWANRDGPGQYGKGVDSAHYEKGG
jgi:hypothetical protein